MHNYGLEVIELTLRITGEQFDNLPRPGTFQLYLEVLNSMIFQPPHLLVFVFPSSLTKQDMTYDISVLFFFFFPSNYPCKYRGKYTELMRTSTNIQLSTLYIATLYILMLENTRRLCFGSTFNIISYPIRARGIIVKYIFNKGEPVTVS